MQQPVFIAAPTVTARLSRETVASLIAKLIAGGRVASKADVGRATGLSRTTIDAGVRALVEANAVRVSGLQPSPGRGRPAEVLVLNPDFGLILVADCGATVSRCGVFDIGQQRLGVRDIEIPIGVGPDAFLAEVVATFEEMLSELGLTAPARTTIIGLPGPVDYWGGTVVRPPIMPGWDGFPIVAGLRDALGGEVILENDVNLRALGEARSVPALRGPLLYVKVGSGIGMGIVGPDGLLVRGADGAAGDIGHIRVAGSEEPCLCGSSGCLEAVASIRAVGRALEVDHSGEAELVEEVVSRVRRRDPAATMIVKERAAIIGEAIVTTIQLLNPERIVIGGQLAAASDDLLAVIRSIVYSRALSLATRNLVVARPALGADSGMAGGLAVGIEATLSPEALVGRLRSAPSLAKQIEA
ncbi:ROK family protein [Amnibacterium flavum]|nr:ROK family protein [Amnibacterium flavum]